MRKYVLACYVASVYCMVQHIYIVIQSLKFQPFKSKSNQKTQRLIKIIRVIEGFQYLLSPGELCESFQKWSW